MFANENFPMTIFPMYVSNIHGVHNEKIRENGDQDNYGES